MNNNYLPTSSSQKSLRRSRQSNFIDLIFLSISTHSYIASVKIFLATPLKICNFSLYCFLNKQCTPLQKNDCQNSFLVKSVSQYGSYSPIFNPLHSVTYKWTTAWKASLPSIQPSWKIQNIWSLKHAPIKDQNGGCVAWSHCITMLCFQLLWTLLITF